MQKRFQLMMNLFILFMCQYQEKRMKIFHTVKLACVHSWQKAKQQRLTLID